MSSQDSFAKRIKLLRPLCWVSSPSDLPPASSMTFPKHYLLRIISKFHSICVRGEGEGRWWCKEIVGLTQDGDVCTEATQQLRIHDRKSSAHHRVVCFTQLPRVIFLCEFITLMTRPE